MYFLIQLQCRFTISIIIIHFDLFVLLFYQSLVLSYSLLIALSELLRVMI